MKYNIEINKPSSNKGIILCLGFFDGMHIGHQELIKKTLETAKNNDLDSTLCV